MMEGAEGYDILVADFLAEPPTLGEAEMMGMGRLAIADEAGELGHTPEMGFIAYPAFKTEPKLGFVDSQALRNLGGRGQVNGNVLSLRRR